MTALALVLARIRRIAGGVARFLKGSPTLPPSLPPPPPRRRVIVKRGGEVLLDLKDVEPAVLVCFKALRGEPVCDKPCGDSRRCISFIPTPRAIAPSTRRSL